MLTVVTALALLVLADPPARKEPLFDGESDRHVLGKS
jgi:hypothetical protein